MGGRISKKGACPDISHSSSDTDKKKKKKNKKSSERESSSKSPEPERVQNTYVKEPSSPTIISSKLRVRALYNFDRISNDDLSFRAGDLLEIESGKNLEDAGWLMATHLGTTEIGYIPTNYVAKDDASPQSQDWWFEFDRPAAEKALLLPGNTSGTFLIRHQQDKKNFAISILTIDANTQEPHVRHYRIRNTDEGGFYINSHRIFTDLIALTEYYKKPSDGASGVLPCPLTVPCPRTRPALQFRELEVNRDAVKLIVKLGAGCFGEVWKAKFRKVVDVAVKTLKPGTMSSEAFLGEAKIMHQLTHPRLVQLIAVVSSDEPFYIITELMSNGSLLDFLHSDKGKKLKLPHVIKMNEQIADGMAYLESSNNIHRDLRAANILVGEHYDVKIADFGLAKILEDDVYCASNQTKFPIKWTSPEAANMHKFSIKSDVWSFGILMSEIITLGRTPYPGMNGRETLAYLEMGGRMEKPVGTSIPVPDAYYDMMCKCWHQEPESRPTFESLFDFFSNYEINVEPNYKDLEDS